MVRMHIPKTYFAGVLAASVAGVISLASGLTDAQDAPSPPPITVYVQVSDARFDSYLFLKKTLSPNREPQYSDEFFHIPSAFSKERERELANWRRRFNLIVSAATLSESVQAKASHVKEEFGRANAAAECWIVDRDRERRITVTMIGSASNAAMEREYRAASRDFFANPRNFTCKYRYDRE